MTPEEIKELRQKLGLTQEGLARALDVSNLTVNRWERGVFKPMKIFVDKMKKLNKKKAA